MKLGYRVTYMLEIRAVIVKYTLPPRPDIEALHREIAEEVDRVATQAGVHLFRINDLSTFDAIPIFSLVVRAMAHEVKGLPGTSSDPRMTPFFVGKGRDAGLIVEALKQRQYGSWNVPLFPTLDDALAHIRAALNAAA